MAGNDANVVTIRSSAVTLAYARDRYLAEHGLSRRTRRAYASTLTALVEDFGEDTNPDSIDTEDIADFMLAHWDTAAPSTWNRHLSTLRSFFEFAGRHGWLATGDPSVVLERRREPKHASQAISYETLDALWNRPEIDLREKVLWRLAFETAARIRELLNLDIDDLDLANKRAVVLSKGGAKDFVHWQSGTARLLPKYIDDRTRGPLFVTHIRPGPGHTPAAGDICPDTGLARLSYQRAWATFHDATDGKYTLHQLRHSALTMLAEEHGVSTPMLMAKSRHTSMRSLERYVKPSVEAVTSDSRDRSKRPPTQHPE